MMVKLLAVPNRCRQSYYKCVMLRASYNTFSSDPFIK